MDDWRRRTVVWASLLVAMFVFFPSSVAAQDAPYSFGSETEAFFLGGLTGGASFGSPGGGGFVGSELSLVWLDEKLWGGIYVDGAYDFGHAAATFSFGPELGWALFGLDGGGALRLGMEDDPELGVHARLVLGIGVVSLFGRYGWWPDAEDEHVGQVGVLLKLPLWSSARLEAIAR